MLVGHFHLRVQQYAQAQAVVAAVAAPSKHRTFALKQNSLPPVVMHNMADDANDSNI